MDAVKYISAFYISRVIWTITSNYPNNYYTSMFGEIHAIHNIPCLYSFEDLKYTISSLFVIDLFAIIAMTLANYSQSIVFILTTNMSTIVIVTDFQLGNA